MGMNAFHLMVYHLTTDGPGLVSLPLFAWLIHTAVPRHPLALLAATTAAFFAQRRIAGGPNRIPNVLKYGGRVALVTGSNQGIGFETAKFLYNSGLVVVMGCRSKERAQGAMAKICGRREGDERLHFVELDLSNKSSVKRCAGDVTKLLRSLGKDGLDYLINNAGMIGHTLEAAKEYENQPMPLAANALGPVCLTDLLLPEVKKVRGRIIILTSLSHCMNAPAGTVEEYFKNLNKSNFQTFDAYGASKMGAFQHATALADELKGSGVIVAAVHPGSVATEILVPKPMTPFVKLFYKTAAEGAWTTLYCCFGDDVDTGGFYLNSRKCFRACDPAGYDLEKSRLCLKWMRSLCQ